MSEAPDGATAITVKLSNVEVFNALLSWLVTARPTRLGPVGKEVLPTAAQDWPSFDTDAVTVDPVRTSRSHTGVACMVPPRYVVVPASAPRVMNSISPLGRRSRMTSAASAASEL